MIQRQEKVEEKSNESPNNFESEIVVTLVVSVVIVAVCISVFFFSFLNSQKSVTNRTTQNESHKFNTQPIQHSTTELNILGHTFCLSRSLLFCYHFIEFKFIKC